ncbi:hypothetical protein GBAR_LOCUS15293 [Geodia barretti]|uniref:Uncharacterized protein n=1 Tax=Geodia barretti TaxID=519541 RepID=A0AA35SBY8_GEOBA|nr:hypothetical protein GBAR_LOCUS15293 [Geodia barretti]
MCHATRCIIAPPYIYGPHIRGRTNNRACVVHLSLTSTQSVVAGIQSLTRLLQTCRSHTKSERAPLESPEYVSLPSSHLACHMSLSNKTNGEEAAVSQEREEKGGEGRSRGRRSVKM